MIEVLNIKSVAAQNPLWKSDPTFVYIGRGSPYGNPFKIGPDTSREDVIELYASYAARVKRIRHDIESMFFVDKKLVCHCAPMACHGDYLKSWQEVRIKELEIK